MQPQILSEKPYCKLAESPLFFETLQSCVSSTAFLSHRFKSSPAISGKFAIPGAAGYLMNAGHFRQNLESNGDLNRPRESRGSQPSACFCGTFCTPQKVPIRFPFGSFEVLQTSNQRTKLHLPTNKIKSFCRFAAFAPPSAVLFVAAATTFVASPLFQAAQPPL